MTITTSREETSTAYRDPLICDECGCFVSRHESACAQWQEVTVEANAVTLPVVFHGPHRMLGCPICYQVGFHYMGTRCYGQPIEVLSLIGTIVDAPIDEEVEYGPRCRSCGNRAAICRCG